MTVNHWLRILPPAAQGIVKKEQRPLGVCAQHADALGGVQVFGRKEYPAAHAGVEDGQIVGGRAHHHSAEGVVLGLGFDFEFALGGDVVRQKADAGNRPRIVPCQARRAILVEVGFDLLIGFFFPVLDDDIANAHLTDLFERFLLGALADGEHGNDRGHAEDDTEHGQQGPQLVREQAD